MDASNHFPETSKEVIAVRTSHMLNRHGLAVASFGLMLGVVGMAIAETVPATAANSGTVAPSKIETQAFKVTETLARLASAPAPDRLDPLPMKKISQDATADEIAALHAHLRKVGSFQASPTGEWTPVTARAVRVFQSKHGIAQSGVATVETTKRLNVVAARSVIDQQCFRPGVRVCVSKLEKVGRFFRNGNLIREFDVNIGPEVGDPNYGLYSSTRVGSFRVGDKQVDAVSTNYGYQMPYWIQFDKGIGFHYSEFFDQTGYTSSSMGCVIIGDRATAKWLYENTPMRANIIVY